MEERDWKINLKETLCRNIIWIVFEILIFVIIFIALSKTEHFVDQGFQLMYLVFCLFFTLKLLSWGGQPTIIMEEIRTKRRKRK